ncbi:MAG: M81 family metallopeptidase [Chloroflexi bacterium]|nr:M81 family metallopeptidase [Chloroflexota bacterium]MCY3937204.1 M81 family metallopeptidase [Chloroflexota bacterium]
MRIAVGGLMQESNSFSPVGTVLADFESEYLLRGTEIPEFFAGTNTEIAGFLNACESAGAETIPLFAAAANSGGNVTADTFATLSGELLGSLRQVTAEAPVNVLLLALHGSMCVDGEDDPEGAVLDSCRSIVGPECVIGASLDLHANVTERMVRAADVLVGYRTYPHVDQASTAQRAASAALSATKGPRLHTVLQELPLLVPAEHMQTTDGPMHELRTQADLVETEGLAAVSVFGVQPWLDFPGVGCSVTVVGSDEAAARDHARRLAGEFWRRRDRFAVELMDIERGVREALETEGGPVVLVDSADCPSSGAPGDSAAIPAALLDYAGTGVDVGGLCLTTVVDAEAAAAAQSAGVGASIDLTVGGKLDPARSKGVRFAGRVERVTDGRFVRKGPAFTGLPLDAGPSAVLAHGSVRVLVTSKPVPTSDPEFFRAAGLEPADAKIVSIKSPTLFRASYDRFARRIIYVDTPGAASANLRQFPWKRISRPIYPLDDFDWEP